MNNLMQDVRYAVRMLLKSPSFTVIAVITLALGIGANTAIFSVVNAILLTPLPVDKPGEIVGIYTSDYSGPTYGTSSYPDVQNFQAGTTAFQGMAAYTLQPLTLEGGENSERIFGEVVSGEYFQVLGIRPSYGRMFLPEENVKPGTHPVVVLSHAFWQRRLGGDPAIVGQSIKVNGQALTVVGIAPANFPGMIRGLKSDVWVPMMMLDRLVPREAGAHTNRGNRLYYTVGRLKPGITPEATQRRLAMVAEQLHKEFPESWTDVRDQARRVTVVPEFEARIFPDARGPVIGFSAVLMVVVGLVLMVACSNVANLLLARATARRREIAIRLSLGATRGRLIRQLVTESTLLSILGGAAGILLAMWGADALARMKPPLPVPLDLTFGIDARVMIFTGALAVLTGILFGLAPALQATRPDVVPALKDEGGAGIGLRKNRLRSTLVVVQVAFSMLLLIATGLFIRSLGNAHAINPGFDLRNGALLTMDVGQSGYDAARGARFYRELLERARAIPGVESATLARELPLGIETSRRAISIQDYQDRPGDDMEFHHNTVATDYLRTMGIALLRGRDFTEQDRAGAPLAALVNETFARRFWPTGDALGKRISQEGSSGPWMEIVGVVRDGNYASLGEDPRPWYATPILQDYRQEATLILRSRGDVKSVLTAARAEIRAIDKAVPVLTSTVQDHLSLSLFPARAAAGIVGFFGTLAVLLAMVGLYGVMSYTVAQRTHEVGVRMALGARHADVVTLIVRQGMKLALIGAGIGIALAAGATRALGFLLYGISPTDPLTFAGVTLLLVAVAFAAAYLPARRAARVDPMVALRYE